MSTEDERVERLLEFREKIRPRELFPTLEENAAILIEENHFAFALAAVLDRGMPAEIVWTIPYYLKKEIGNLEPQFFASQSTERLEKIFRNLPKKPRYITDAPKTVKQLSEIVLEDFEGEVTNIWQGRKAEDVESTFQRIYGVGPGISSMIVLLLEKCFKIDFTDVDHESMDVKPDTHVVRVFRRLGFIAEPSCENALEVARDLNPEYPGALDSAAWVIGKRWCSPSNPNCNNCPAEKVCPKNNV